MDALVTTCKKPVLDRILFAAEFGQPPRVHLAEQSLLDDAEQGLSWV